MDMGFTKEYLKIRSEVIDEVIGSLSDHIDQYLDCNDCPIPKDKRSCKHSSCSDNIKNWLKEQTE